MEEKVYRTELTPVSFLERSASIFPDKTAIVHGERRYTYREFAERVYRLASHLRSIGMQKHAEWLSYAQILPRCSKLTMLYLPLAKSSSR